MSGKKAIIITILVIVCLFTGLWGYNHFAGQIENNPAGTIGNTAGNLNNGGYFCESDGRVYFANAYDGGSLYSMNADESDIRKLANAEVMFINQAGKHLYYYQKDSQGASSLGFVTHMAGLYRSQLNGDKILCLDKSDCYTVSLVGNTIFYEKAVKGSDVQRSLYRISTDKKDMSECVHFMVNPACATNGGFYYSGTVNDHYLYFYNEMTGASNQVADYDMWFPTLCDNYIYFMDTKNDYQLCRYSLASQQMDVLTTDRVDFFNVYGNYIYYQKVDNKSPALMRMYIDGSNPEVVAEGNYCDINITSQFVYFRAFGAPEPIYHTTTNGPVAVSNFDGARAAALKNMK